MDTEKYTQLAMLAGIIELVTSSVKKASGNEIADIPDEELSELVAARLHKKIMARAGGAQ